MTALSLPAFAETDQQNAENSHRSSEILVTATRRSSDVESESATKTASNFLHVPQSVQVLTSSLIDAQDRRTLAEALVNVSGVTPARTQEALFTQPIVRGFASEIYIDGLPAYGTNAAIDPNSLVGIARIEVVKGPTSTIHGGGTGAPLGGLINVVSKAPNREYGGVVAIRTGSFGTVAPYLDLSVPLGGIAVRLSGGYESTGSWIDAVKGSKWSIKPSISLQLGSKTDIVIRAQYDRRLQLEYSGLPAAQALAGQIERDAFPGAATGQPNTSTENRLLTIGIRHHFSETARLSATARYYQSDIREFGSFVYPDVMPPDQAAPTTYSIFKLYLPNRVKEGIIDANVSATIDALGAHHVALVGISYDHTDSGSAVAFDGVPVGEIDLAHPNSTLSFGGTPKAMTRQTNRYETIAGYFHDQASLGRFHLSASLRFTQLRLRQMEQSIERTYREVTPRIGASFDIVAGLAFFAGYATGFRGATNFVGLDAPKPETSVSFEGGLKLALAGAHLRGTIAAFDMTRGNVTTPDPDHPFYSVQSGKQRARGLEADLTWVPVSTISILAAYAFTDAVVVKDTSIPEGDRLARVPRHSGRVAARYRVVDGRAKGFSFGAGITALTPREAALPNSVSVPGYALIDVQAGYDFGRFSFVVSAANLGASSAYDTYQYLSFPVVIPIQPRSAFVTLRTRL